MTIAHTFCRVALKSPCLFFSTRNCSSSKNSHKPITFSFFQSYDGMMKTSLCKGKKLIFLSYTTCLYGPFFCYFSILQYLSLCGTAYFLSASKPYMAKYRKRARTRIIARIHNFKTHQCALHWLQVVQKAREREFIHLEDA